jgi:hypothetical protein
MRLKLTRKTVWLVLKNDLKLSAYKKKKIHGLTSATVRIVEFYKGLRGLRVDFNSGGLTIIWRRVLLLPARRAPSHTAKIVQRRCEDN